MRNQTPKELITLEKDQLEHFLGQVFHSSGLLLALSNANYSKMESSEIQAAIYAAFRVNEANYAELLKLLGVEDD